MTQNAAQTGRGHRFLPSLAALSSLFVFAASAAALPAALVRAAEELAVSPERLACVVSVQFAGFFLATVVGGVLADVLGKKPVFQTACVLVLGGGVLFGCAQGLRMAVLAGLLMGMGGGVLESMSSALLSDLFPERRKLFLNLSQVVFCAGAVGCPFLMGKLLPLGVSWRAFFFAISGLSILLFVAYTLSAIPPPQAHERMSPARLRCLVRKGSFLVPCLVIFCYVLAESCVVVYANLYLQEYRAAPENWAIYSIAAVWLTIAVGRLLCAAIPERHSYERLIAALFLVSAASLAAQGLVSGWPASFTLFAVTGLAFAGTWPMVVGMAASRNPAHSGTVVGLTIAAGALGVVAAPPFMNALLGAVPPAQVFVFAAVPLFVGGLVVLVGPRGRAPEETA